MLRRGLALGAGLLVLILLVLGVKGCLNARKERALTDYARNVTQIVDETDQTSKAFFGRLSDPESLTVTEFVAEVKADRSAMDNYAGRVYGLDAPGDMSHAQGALELVYELRSAAMTEIANQMNTALGEIGAKKAALKITAQMRKLLASDELYAAVVRPEINGVLADNGIDGNDVPKSLFVPEGAKWLEESAVSEALGSVNGSTAGAATPGVHGLELVSTAVSGTELSSESTTVVESEGTPEVEVEVENQGESAESGVTVSVSVDGGPPVQQDISSIELGEIQSVAIPLVPVPSGTKTLEVDVQTVPGERVDSNNKASYTVEFK